MPVKKTPKKKVIKKKTTKKTPKKSVQKKKKINTKGPDEKELKKAVAKLPGLIIEKARLEEKVPASNPTIEAPKDVIEIRELKPSGEIKTRVGQNYDDGRDKKWLMWLGVIIFTIAIFILWGWNLIVKVQDSAKIEDLGIIKGVKEDIQSTLDTTEPKEDKESPFAKATGDKASEAKSPEAESGGGENLKEKIKQNIANIITAFETSTTTTSTETTEENVVSDTDILDEKIIEQNNVKDNNEIITPSL